MITFDNRKNVHKVIDHIFQELFPAHGMPERQEQMRLSHLMLDAMLDGKIALCEAGTGIGKTYAYLVAGFVQSKYQCANSRVARPVIISTSSIALQDALTKDYIPFLSRLFMKDGLTAVPLTAVVRKGKAHYVCDERLEKRIRKAGMARKNKANRDSLLSMQKRLDLDQAEKLSDYDKRRICVPVICECGREECRYLRFLGSCSTNRYLFQICNHNLLVADLLRRKRGQKGLLPDASVLIVDEAHKFPEAARQMLGETLTREDFRDVINGLKQEQYLLASQNLAMSASSVMYLLSKAPDEERPVEDYLARLNAPNQMLETIRRQLTALLTTDTRVKLEQLCSATSQFCQSRQGLTVYVTESERGGTMLCTAVDDLEEQLGEILWSFDRSILLTSGTIAVNGSFRRFESECGLKRRDRVMEAVFTSPFDYKQNCLLYFPCCPPRLDKEDRAGYFGVLSIEIAHLLEASHGHALILFTSYAALSMVKERLERKKLGFPLFAMGRNRKRSVEQFKNHPGSVLLATGSAWEGMDFPGDCVSLLIVPRLPFAYPDARMEREKERYPSLQAFIRAVAVPDMQIKLRQGFGRAIRNEKDTCVIAILDERACPGQRYHQTVMEALPEMPVTSELQAVRQFIRRVQPDSYFIEG